MAKQMKIASSEWTWVSCIEEIGVKHFGANQRLMRSNFLCPSLIDWCLTLYLKWFIEMYLYSWGFLVISLTWPFPGGSVDWVKSEIGAFFPYTIELRDEGSYGFIAPTKEIYPAAMEAIAAVTVISEAASQL